MKQTKPHYPGLEQRPWLAESTILYGIHGSHCYGTNVADSDEDFKGICMAPRILRNGFLGKFEQAESNDPDVVIYELRKFYRLAVKCNPNILELLWMDEEYLLKMTPAGKRLRDRRDMFLSKRAFYSYAGYAESQLKRLDGYRNNSTKRKVLRDTFGYDTKFGMHLIRLLRMLVEILEQKTIIVHRPDAEELVAIRNGAWTKEKLVAEGARLKDKAEKLILTSKLPDEPNLELLNSHCSMMYHHYDLTGETL
jgi:predicted nucleotidyltransferase